MEVSKKFYAELFGQQVTLDLGWNVTFSGGFAIQQNFSWLTGIPEGEIAEKSNNMEMYFEADDFDAFLALLAKHPEVRLVHPPKKYDWQQRVVRIYDPDNHIIEIGEAMAVIIKRCLAEGKTVEETASLLQHPVAFIQQCCDEMEK